MRDVEALGSPTTDQQVAKETRSLGDRHARCGIFRPAPCLRGTDDRLNRTLLQTLKDDRAQAQIVELWVAEELRDLAKVAKIEEAAGFGVEPEVPQAQS